MLNLKILRIRCQSQKSLQQSPCDNTHIFYLLLWIFFSVVACEISLFPVCVPLLYFILAIGWINQTHVIWWKVTKTKNTHRCSMMMKKKIKIEVRVNKLRKFLTVLSSLFIYLHLQIIYSTDFFFIIFLEDNTSIKHQIFWIQMNLPLYCREKLWKIWRSTCDDRL